VINDPIIIIIEKIKIGYASENSMLISVIPPYDVLDLESLFAFFLYILGEFLIPKYI
jgi:hypothetical protein